MDVLGSVLQFIPDKDLFGVLTAHSSLVEASKPFLKSVTAARIKRAVAEADLTMVDFLIHAEKMQPQARIDYYEVITVLGLKDILRDTIYILFFNKNALAQLPWLHSLSCKRKLPALLTLKKIIAPP